ncbi:MAG: polysaccharide deacetylase family protein [Vicingaceae bacterium]
MFLAKTPAIIKRYYPQLTWDIPNNEQKIYLTFDDGPIPEITEWVLDLLNQKSIKATFFCIGENVQKHPKIFQRIKSEGHAIGNHTFNHLNGWKTGSWAYLKSIEECQQFVHSNLFRPPYGRIKKSQANKITRKYKVVMWDVLSGDFDQKTAPEKCYENVVQNVNPGSIIVFHDSLKAERNLKYALPKAIDYLQRQGFVFEVLD